MHIGLLPFFKKLKINVNFSLVPKYYKYQKLIRALSTVGEAVNDESTSNKNISVQNIGAGRDLVTVGHTSAIYFCRSTDVFTRRVIGFKDFKDFKEISKIYLVYWLSAGALLPIFIFHIIFIPQRNEME
jgi:hypothetical protein